MTWNSQIVDGVIKYEFSAMLKMGWTSLKKFYLYHKNNSYIAEISNMLVHGFMNILGRWIQFYCLFH